MNLNSNLTPRHLGLQLILVVSCNQDGFTLISINPLLRKFTSAQTKVKKKINLYCSDIGPTHFHHDQSNIGKPRLTNKAELTYKKVGLRPRNYKSMISNKSNFDIQFFDQLSLKLYKTLIGLAYLHHCIELYQLIM